MTDLLFPLGTSEEMRKKRRASFHRNDAPFYFLFSRLIVQEVLVANNVCNQAENEHNPCSSQNTIASNHSEEVEHEEQYSDEYDDNA